MVDLILQGGSSPAFTEFPDDVITNALSNVQAVKSTEETIVKAEGIILGR